MCHYCLQLRHSNSHSWINRIFKLNVRQEFGGEKCEIRVSWCSASYIQLLYHSKASDFILEQEIGNKNNSNKLQVKVHFTPEEATKAQRGSISIALLFL